MPQENLYVTGNANLVAIKVIVPTLYGEGGIGTVNASRDGLRTAMHVPPMGERTANVFAIVLFRWGVILVEDQDEKGNETS